MKTITLNNKREDNEKYIMLLACFTFGFNPVQDIFLFLLRSQVTIPNDYLLTYLLYLVVIILAFKSIIKRIKWDSVAIIFFFLMSYLASISFYGAEPENWLFLGGEIMLSVSCYLVARSITDYEKFKTYLNVTAILIGISSFFLFFVFKVTEDLPYSQYYGYMALLAAVISASVIIEKFKITHLLNLIISLLVIIYSGARGPLVCFALFIVIKFLLISRISLRKRIAIVAVACTLIALVLLFSQDILIYLSQVGEGKGYSLRLLTLMSNESMFTDEGRDALWEWSLHLITQNPLTGVGIYNDRILLANHFGESLNAVGGSYPHNIFIEVLLQFGLIAGGLMICGFLYIISMVTFKNVNKDTKDLILIFLAIGFFPLLFSASYLQFGLFFLFLGLCVSILKDERNTKKVY